MPGMVQNEIGGNVETIAAIWDVWATVRERTGFSTTAGQREVWQYEYEVEKRYERSRPIRSNYIVIYDGYRHKIESVRITSEARKDFEKILIRRLDTNINGSAPTVNMLPIQITITGTGADNYTNSSLIGAFVDQVTVDGIEHSKMPTNTLSGVEKEFYHNQANGNIKLSQPVPAGVKIIVHYYAV